MGLKEISVEGEGKEPFLGATQEGVRRILELGGRDPFENLLFLLLTKGRLEALHPGDCFL